MTVNEQSRIRQLSQSVYTSFAMLAAMQLDVFSEITSTGRTAAEISDAMGVKLEKLLPLLRMLVVAELLIKKDDKYFNTEESATYLVKSSKHYTGTLAGFYSGLWNACLNTAESIKTAIPQNQWKWEDKTDEQLTDYFGKQFVGCRRAGRNFAQLVDLGSVTRVLDIAGGSGGLCIGLCESWVQLKCTIVDFPRVTKVARTFVEQSDLSDRIGFRNTDVVKSIPDNGYDLVVMRSFLQVLSEDDALKAICNVAQSMEPGAELYIIGCILNDNGVEPLSAVNFGIVFLNFYDYGQSYCESQYRDWLQQAGFTDIHVEYEIFEDGLSYIRCVKSA